MARDYFDRLCEDPSTIIEEEVVLVEDLWKIRHQLADYRKRHRLLWFYDAFRSLIEQLNAGHVFTAEDMKEASYWEYIEGYHKSWSRVPKTESVERQMIRKFKDSIDLFHDIKKRGMIDPLDVIVEGKRKTLYRGNRRLVILKALGTEKARVRYAIEHNSFSS